MAESEKRTEAIRRNVQSLLRMIRLMKDSNAFKETERRLESLHNCVVQSSCFDPTLDLEFCSIVESHPKLRDLAQVVFQEELVELCKSGLEHYAAIEKVRPLTVTEQSQFRSGEDLYGREKAKLEQMLMLLYPKE